MENSKTKYIVPNHIKSLIPYKAGKPIKELERELGVLNSVKMASNENPLGPSPKAVEAIRRSLNNIHFYPDGSGFYLKQKLAELYKIDKENIILGNGSNEIIELAVRTFVTSPANIIMAETSFIVYRLITQAAGFGYKEVPLCNHRHDLIRMADKIDKETKLIFIANPNNPTGTAVDHKDMEAFLKMVPSRILVVVDEAYFEYVESSTFPDMLTLQRRYDNLIIMRTFSKIYGLAGLRIGYAISHRDIIEYLNRVRQPFNVNMPAQEAALASVSDIEHVKKSRRINSEGKRYLYKEFERLNIYYVPSETNFILFKVPNSKDIYDKLLLRGVIVRLMGEGYNIPDYLRVTIGLPEDNERFIRALKKIL